MKTFASYGMYKIHQDRYWYVMLRTRIFVPDNEQYFYSLHYRTLVAEIKQKTKLVHRINGLEPVSYSTVCQGTIGVLQICNHA